MQAFWKGKSIPAGTHRHHSGSFLILEEMNHYIETHSSTENIHCSALDN